MRFSLVLALVPAVAGCAAPAPPTGVSNPARQCFAPSEVRSYQNLDEEALLLRARANEIWRLDFQDACPKLRFNLAGVGLRQSVGGRICGGQEFDVVFNDAGVPRSCPVKQARRLTEADVAALPPGARP